jgi:hypothetical protein
MSEAKREHSQYHRAVAVGRPVVRFKAVSVAPQRAPSACELQLLEAWESTAASSGDPYNGIGARVSTPQKPRK